MRRTLGLRSAASPSTPGEITGAIVSEGGMHRRHQEQTGDELPAQGYQEPSDSDVAVVTPCGSTEGLVRGRVRPASWRPGSWVSPPSRPDVAPVDVVPQTGLGRDVDESLGVPRVDQRVEPRRRLIVVDEGVEQVALVVEAGEVHRAEHVQVAYAAPVDLYIQTIGLGPSDA